MVQCHVNVMRVIQDLIVLIKLVLVDALAMGSVLVVLVFVVTGMVALTVCLFVQEQMVTIVMEMEDVLMVFVIVNLVSLDMVAV